MCAYVSMYVYLFGDVKLQLGATSKAGGIVLIAEII